jgi:hypothetical protein
VLRGDHVEQIIWDMIGQAIEDAVLIYIFKYYVAATVAEWARVNFEVQLDPGDLKGYRNINDLEPYLKDQARAEAETNLTATLGEFMGEDESDINSWDLKGLSSWAMSRFHVSLPVTQIKKMSPQELEDKLRDAAVRAVMDPKLPRVGVGESLRCR